MVSAGGFEPPVTAVRLRAGVTSRRHVWMARVVSPGR
jgi:hypothetical protein